MKLPLKWEFPGGKIEMGESEFDCVKREILEELMKLKEHSAHVLLNKNELYKLDWAAADLPILKEFTAL